MLGCFSSDLLCQQHDGTFQIIVNPAICHVKGHPEQIYFNQALARVRPEGQGRHQDRGRAETRVRSALLRGDHQAGRLSHGEHQAQLCGRAHREAGKVPCPVGH